MKARGKKLLAAMLSLAMVLSMFVVPASAVEQAKEWNLRGSGTEWTAEEKINFGPAAGSNTDKTTMELKGLTITASASTAKWMGSNLGSNWVQLGEGTTVEVPVEVPEGQKAVVTIEAYKATTFTVGGKANTKAQNEKEEFICDGTNGKVEIVCTDTQGQAYLGYIAVRYEAATEPEEPTSATPLGAGPRNVSNTGTNAHVDGAIVWAEGKWNFNGDHGPQSKGDDSTVTLLLAKPEEGKVVDVTFETCAAYGSQGNVTVTGPEGSTAGAATVVETGAMRSDGDTAAYAVKVSGIEVTEAEAGKGQEVTFTVKGSTYVHGFTVAHVEKATTPDPGPEEPAENAEAGTIDFQALAANVTGTETIGNNTYGAVPTVKGLTVSADALVQTGGSHGLYAKSDGATVALNLSAAAKITLVECQYGKNKISKVTAGETDITLPTPTGDADMTYVFENVAAGEFKLTLNTGAYIHSIKIEYVTPDPEPAENAEAGTIDFQALAANVTGTETIGNNTYGAVPAVKGLTVSADALVQTGGSHGLYAKSSGVTVALNLSAAAKITLVECQYGKDKISKVTAGETDITLPTPTGDADMTYVFENVAAGEFKLTLNAGAYIHSIKIEYVTPDPEPAENVEAGTIDFQALAANVTGTETIGNNTYGAVPAVKGLTVSADALVQTGGSHGLYAKSDGATVALNLSAAAKITLVECQYGKNKISKVTAGETDITLPTPTGDADMTYVFENVAAGEFKLTLNAGAYIHSIKVEYITTEPEPEPEPGNGKVDVYDFGAEQLDTAKFNNKLTVDDINAWYPGVTPGSKDKALPSTATTGMFTYEVSGGGDRLRTSNTALTRYDETNNRCDLAAGQDPYEPNRTSYTGVICSNGGTVTLKMVAGAGDKITYIMGSNAGTAYTTTFTGADGSTKEAEVPAAHGAVTFYAPETGRQSLFSGVENGNRPAVARIYVEQPTAVEVSGTLTIDESLADATGLKLVFTNDDSGIATEATITGGTYTVSLNNYQSGTSYTVTAKGITGSVVKVGKALAFTKDTDDTATHNITAGRVALVDVSGSVTGLDAVSLARLKLTLTPPEGEIYVPEITRTDDAWSAQLQSGIEYAVAVENVNDYTLDTTTVKYSADATDAAIAFTAKPTYAVTIVPTGLTLAELADAAFTFTNVSETYEGANGKPVKYAYTFTGPGAIALRDGQYKVEVDTTKGRQELTPDLKVKGAAVNCPVGFDVSVPTAWDFSAADFTDAAYAVSGDKTYYGLLIGDGLKKENGKAHVGGNAGTIRIPVTGDCAVNVTVYYAAAGTVGVGADTVALVTTTSTNSTNATDTITYNYTGGEGYVDVTVTGTTYITKIETVYASGVEFKDTVTVGEDKDCATITEALELVAKMPRSGERVTILIDPGDYEEQLLVEVPNVTLKNAKAAEAKLELKDKGVGIGGNEVRITHYYGHGYTYYSMTDGHRYNEKVLAVNKQNGYPSFINKGAGSDGNSYWNASVVVKADGFQAEGIIFENSFNQYVSAKATKDVIVPQAGAAKEGATPRAELPEGSTTVQEKAYVERATALAMDGADEAFFENCAFIGRQDVVYGGVGTTAAFYDCDVYGGTDYIFGGMNAVFAKCDLVLNTSEHKNDVAYITAGQQNSGDRGYLMYNCSVISTVPGVNTASKLPSKPGTFGRAWSPNCEVVFYETIVDSTTTKADGTEGTQEVSLIQPIGWKDGLGGNFDRCAEYHTHEIEGTVPARLAPAQVLGTPVLSDSTAIDYETWLGGWKPFEGKDMTVLGCPDTSHTITFRVDTGASVADLAADGKPETLNSKSQLLALKEAVVTFKIDVTEGYTLTKVTGATWDDQSVYTVNADTVVISVRSPSGSSDMVPTGPSGGSGKGETVTNPDGSKTTTVTDRKGNTTVTTVAVDGSKVEKITTKAGDKTVTVTDAKGEVQVKIELPAVIPAPETKFADVPEGHWAEKAVNDMAGLGLVKGVSDNSFDMDSPITRGSVATILFRLSNGAEGKASGFTDVKAGDWYADAVAWAAGTGVVTGYSETIFAPNDSITREQFAVMLYRFAKLINMDTTASGEVSAFSDASSVAAWAGDAMTWCVGAGILNGVSDPVQGITLSPAKTASRAECAVMLGRFIALI